MTAAINALVWLPEYGHEAERFPAYVDPGEQDGQVVPFFDRRTAIAVVTWVQDLYAANLNRIHYARWDGDTVVTSNPQIPGEEIVREQHADGWWWIGAFDWMWECVPD